MKNFQRFWVSLFIICGSVNAKAQINSPKRPIVLSVFYEFHPENNNWAIFNPYKNNFHRHYWGSENLGQNTFGAYVSRDLKTFGNFILAFSLSYRQRHIQLIGEDLEKAKKRRGEIHRANIYRTRHHRLQLEIPIYYTFNLHSQKKIQMGVSISGLQGLNSTFHYFGINSNGGTERSSKTYNSLDKYFSLRIFTRVQGVFWKTGFLSNMSCELIWNIMENSELSLGILFPIQELF